MTDPEYDSGLFRQNVIPVRDAVSGLSQEVEDRLADLRTNLVRASGRHAGHLQPML